jgi:hypothetical protein
MTDFKRGQIVRIPCEIQPGAFRNEHLVTIEIEGRKLSGFVQDSYITKEANINFVIATIIRVTAEGLLVDIPGSFFTVASGETCLPPAWATKYLQPATAY